MSNNSPSRQIQKSTESDSENSIELKVNLDALQKSASNVFHLQCISIQEFSEGGFHKVFIWKMENGKEYIGRVAFPVYPQLKTESEVAVMKYIHLNPVPNVYYWNSSTNNPVEVEYILMDHMPGIRLCDIWSDLSIEKKKIFLLKIINIQLELKKLTFSKIGMIVFFFNGKNDKFKIGQVIESDFFTGERANLSTMERGPFNTANEYISAVIRNQILYHNTFKFKEQQTYWIPKYGELYKLVPKYFPDNNQTTYVLMHGDFHSANILVSDDGTTGLSIGNVLSEANLMLQKFFRDEMSRRSPDFIRTFENIEEEKKEFYSAVFSQEIWKVEEFFNKFGKYNF
ncbi:19142_t:CDS:2 [Gigaspora margarita]|uniref:Altered inheritance of mitochondria protein 9, mitochondrial n=1 Tax=Gigaspora margarita TaxID=4874 RepID=A0ABN7UDC9_GIGMA|nr:19142_t:CDS:2 [Gigaspora margarita]